ncbi:hypothetical protein [Halohasta litchfieldiae]|jgi:site-specific recombinase XerD|nr:hypothetical protein [Halohasta litchfieldiae]
MSLDEFLGFYRGTIYPEMLQDDLDPTETTPTYEWLTEQGYSGMAYALREHHDLSLNEFFVEVVGDVDDDEGDGYDWGICHEPTVDAIQEFLEAKADRRNLADSTTRSRKYKLAQFARKYEKHHGSADLLEHLDDPDNESDELRRCMQVFDEFNDELSTNGTKLKYCDVVRQFYEHLVEFFGAEFNPIDRVSKQYDWERKDSDNLTVDRAGMRDIYESTGSNEDRLLVLALGAWGLRPNEVGSAHVSQFVLGSGDLSLDATLDNGIVLLAVTTDGTAVENATVSVDGEEIGTTDYDGRLRFPLDGRPAVEVQVTADRTTQTVVYAAEDGDLDAVDDAVDPHITFDERKNGPGSVSLLFGQDVLEQRIETLATEDWNGYLFPSKRSSSGHITAETVNNRFKKLAEDAGATVDGATPTAKMGRRFWYSIYSDATEAFVEQLGGIASDQGSSSAEIVYSNYLSEEDRRKGRRAMREELAQVFGN